MLDVLKDSLAGLPDELIDLAGSVLDGVQRTPTAFVSQRTRAHSASGFEFTAIITLGQVLQVKTDYVIVDFEGEPARPIAERRAKLSPLKDVAGMIRSLSYAVYSGLVSYTTRLLGLGEPGTLG